MLRTISFLFAVIFAISSCGQNSEGEIIYKNSYKSKMPNLTDEQFTRLMGPTQQYFIKNGDYKSILNGSLVQWQLYVNKDNKIYTKLANSEVLTSEDAAINKDEVLKVELNKGVTDILGYTCDELILTCKTGIQKYYFNTKISVDAQQFSQHKFGNWYSFLSKSNSLPLRMIIDNDHFTLESVATQIKEIRLEKNFFELPKDAKTVENSH